MYRRRTKPTIPAVKEEKKEPRVFPAMTMTVDEMADELCISRPTAYELVKQAGFPAFHIGNRIIVNRKGLQEWIDRQCATRAA